MIKKSKNIKKLWDILFYVLLFLITLFIVKKKVFVPKIDTTTLNIYTLDQSKIDLNTLKGKVIVLNFWQTWCGPCKKELPSLNQMKDEWSDLYVISISDEDINLLKDYEILYPNIQFASTSSLKNIGINQYPTTYILNKKGIKVYSKIGAKNWSDSNFIAKLKQNWN